MPQENLELVQQALDAANRRDRDSWLALCDPELENIPPRDWPESEPVRGGEAVFDFLVIEAQDAWEVEGSPFQYAQLIDAGDDKVVGDLRRDVRGKASGASVAWRYWQVVTLRDGKILRIQWFGERAPALNAVGLSD